LDITQSQSDVSFMQALTISIGTIIVSVCFYIAGGENHGLDNFLFPGAENSVGTVQESNSFRKIFEEVAQGLRNKAYKTEAFWMSVIGMTLQFAQLAFVLAISWISGSFWVGVVAVSGFIFGGTIIKKRWHFKQKPHTSDFLIYAKCTGLTAALFFAIARILPSFIYSWFLGVLAGIFACYAFYRIECFAEVARNNAAYRKRMEAMLEFRLERGCDYEKMREIATFKGLDAYEIDLLDKKFCKQWPNSQIHAFFSGHGAPRTVASHLAKAKERFNASIQ